MSPENPRTTGPQADPEQTRAWHRNHYAHSSPSARPAAWMRFDNRQDPYNTENLLSGWVHMTGGDNYGMLEIESVNERPAPQRIMATPKTRYPYRYDNLWLLDQAEYVRSATKYDGTNICQYSYQDADGMVHTTYKLRTRPFVLPFFRILLDRTLRNYPKVAHLRLGTGEAMIYELYGRQNHLLIEYDQDIDLMALCRRDPETGGLQPADPDDRNFARLDCPLAATGPPTPWTDFRTEYQRRQTGHSQTLTPTQVDGQRAFRGDEGEMLYVTFSDGAGITRRSFTRLIKLKPPEIEEIHQTADFIPREEIEATVRNIWETTDDPGMQELTTLLLEDWTQHQIDESMETVTIVLGHALERRQYEDDLLQVYRQHFRDESFRANSAQVMRTLAGHLPRSDMARAYAVFDKRLP